MRGIVDRLSSKEDVTQNLEVELEEDLKSIPVDIEELGQKGRGMQEVSHLAETESVTGYGITYHGAAIIYY